MKRQIPEGTVIGEIKAPLALLLSHIPNYLGAIIIRISTGKGFILFEYGRTVGYSFAMGELVLEGAAARRFFQQEEVLKASLRQYSEEEFQEALAVAWPNALIPLSTGQQRGGRVDSSPAPGYRVEDTVPGGIDHFVFEDEPIIRPQDPWGMASGDPTGAILDRFIRSPGVIAAAFFRDGSISASRGRAISEDMVEPAEEILLPAWEAMTLVSDGPLVQVTLQLADRNVTISPYDDGYLLFMTEPGINLGRIRRLLQEAAGIG
ncbi:MAG: hypothetical protein HGA55_03030 [Methanoregulaceae archaeon]|nr:hypothetical protein [Methanoregulaceae archaeon]